MKNADMPAMPCEVQVDINACNQARALGRHVPSQITYQGLTKREMMAMHAPEMPDWFDGWWRKEFEGNEMYFKEEEDEWGCSYLQITKHGVKAMYFAWRTTYADSLLSELERTCLNP